jgi:hypothetical protein
MRPKARDMRLYHSQQAICCVGMCTNKATPIQKVAMYLCVCNVEKLANGTTICRALHFASIPNTRQHKSNFFFTTAQRSLSAFNTTISELKDMPNAASQGDT